ncbi:AAA family ATPase [Mycolicibacterium sp. CBMA 226]|uniref:AAA family ATPase n=1 Tax=Mycolicibacterium sp. CBMA 226 TaxID=2606611 RepID=UPI001FB575D7|nr:AAA family ATPase [Mycolicibacterium sp. CBMA 226]
MPAANSVPPGGRICLADVAPAPQGWLWPGRVPVGRLVTLEGGHGVGRSTLALTMAAAASTGGRWPDGTRCNVSGPVLLLHRQRELADRTRPRLDAAHADLSRIHSIAVAPPQGKPVMSTLLNVVCLNNEIQQTSACMAIVDVELVELLGAGYKDDDVRQALAHLADLAESCTCTVLFVMPDGCLKANGDGAFDRVSVRYRADRLPGGDCALSCIKNNLAVAAPPLIYRLVGMTVGQIDAAGVEWLGRGDGAAVGLLAEVQDRRGDMSKSVAEYVNSRPATINADVEGEFDLARKVANQHLRRLLRAGLIQQLGRGTYGPLGARVSDDEDRDDSEDAEDSADQALVGNPQPAVKDSPSDSLVAESRIAAQNAPGATQIDSGTDCPGCGRRRSSAASGPCGECIGKRHSAKWLASKSESVEGQVDEATCAPDVVEPSMQLG